MSDVIRLIWALVVDLFRSRAALEAEVLVLRQQVVVLRRGRPIRPPMRAIDRGWCWDGSAGCFRTRVTRWRWFHRRPSCVGTGPDCDRTGVGSRGADRVVRRCRRRSAIDPCGEPCQSAVGSTGSTANCSSWESRSGNQRGQIHGAEEGASVAGLEDLPSQPCGWHHRDAPVRGADTGC
jgi:hypothetical protein